MDLYFIREEVLMDKTIYRSIKYKGFYRRDRGGGEG